MKKSTPLQFLIRTVIYCIGLFFLALGVAISVNSDLGVSPVNTLPYVVSLITGIPMGSCVTAIFCFYILLQAIILRREFQLVNLLQIVFSTIFGYFVDFAKLLVGDFAIPTYPGKLLMLAGSILIIAIGIVLYMDVQLVPMPMEGLSSCLAKKMGVPFPKMKTIIDSLVVLIGVLLGLLLLGRLDGIREGTIITAVITGKLVAVFKKYLTPIINRLCFGQ